VRALALAAVLSALSCCTPTPDELRYAAEQNGCVVSSSSRATADACRARSRARLCADHPALAVCPRDGGAP
jgi:hypothetical protein